MGIIVVGDTDSGRIGCTVLFEGVNIDVVIDCH